MMSTGRAEQLIAALGGGIAFLIAAVIFLGAIGRPPLTTLGQMAFYAFGDSYSVSESLVKATPILLCALAVILPARLGLITVGGEGQLYFGALTGNRGGGCVPPRPDVAAVAGHAGGGRHRRRNLERCCRMASRPLQRQRNHLDAADELRRGIAGEFCDLRRMEGPGKPRLAGQHLLSAGSHGPEPAGHARSYRIDLWRDRSSGPSYRRDVHALGHRLAGAVGQSQGRHHGGLWFRQADAAGDGDRRRARRPLPEIARPRRFRAGCSPGSRSDTA